MKELPKNQKIVYEACLKLLEKDNFTQADLIRETGLKSGSVADAVNALVRKGYLKKFDIKSKNHYLQTRDSVKHCLMPLK